MGSTMLRNILWAAAIALALPLGAQATPLGSNIIVNGDAETALAPSRVGW